jgi:hypothetical protein
MENLNISDINVEVSSDQFESEISVTSEGVKNWLNKNNLTVELDVGELYIMNAKGIQIATYYYNDDILRFSNKVSEQDNRTPVEKAIANFKFTDNQITDSNALEQIIADSDHTVISQIRDVAILLKQYEDFYNESIIVFKEWE